MIGFGGPISPLNPLLMQVGIWDSLLAAPPLEQAVLVFLLIFSLASWTVVFSKWSRFRQAKLANVQFLRAFRKANALDSVAVASEQFRASPLVTVFDFGYAEVERQVKTRGTLTNKL